MNTECECADCHKIFKVEQDEIEDENFCDDCTVRINAEYAAIIAAEEFAK